MNDGSDGGRVAFEVDGSTLSVRDVIEGNRLRLRVDREPSLSPALPELFPFPVDNAVSFEAESLAIPEYASVAVRNADGDHVAWLDEPMDLPHGSYVIEVNGVTKALVRVTDVEMSASGAAGPDPVTLSFDGPRTVSVGARSLHTRPEATITVPDDPAAMAEAVSVLGSSIKEFSPERSWPTLRGYPPRIERGDTLNIPSPLTVPDTGVEVVVRPTYEDVYRLSTLSYYLGARMTTGDAPAIRLETGYEEGLPTEGRALEDRATELLKTWFFLDTLARTEGYIPSGRYAYEEVGPELPFYPPNLAERSMSERLMEYLEVAPETAAPYLPAWPTEAVLRPVPAAAELLPHLAHVLAPVRVRGRPDPARPDAPMAAATSPQASTIPPGSGRLRAAVADGNRQSAATPEERTETAAVPDLDADPLPVDASILTTSAYENRLRRGTPERGAVDVALLFADAERARSVRESLSGPTELDGIDSWTVLAAPTPGEAVEALSDPELDVVYCGRGVRNAVFGLSDLADGGPRSWEATRGGAPRVTVFEGTTHTAVGVDALGRGGLSAVLVDGRVPAVAIRTLLGLLSTGSPVAVAARLSLSDHDVNVRYAGDPATEVATDRGLSAQVYECWPVSDDSYRISVRSFLSTEQLIGGEYRLIDVLAEPRSMLIGTGACFGEIDVSGVLRLHEERSPIFRFPSDVILWSDDLSAEDVTRIAGEHRPDADPIRSRDDPGQNE